MMRPEVNICFCFILITLISCKPEEHDMKQNDRFCSKQGLVRNEDNNLQHFMVTVSQSKLLKKRLHINITCKSAIYLYMLILQAGDIQIQPGPTYIKYPCGICSKNVNWNAKALQCDGCDIWYHTKCSNVPPHIYKALQGNNLSWICFQCGLPNFSTTFFETEERIEISNRFNTFNDSPPVKPINTLNDSPAVIPINISNPPPDNHAVSMRNFQEASIEITAETSRNSTRSLPKHHLNTTIDELTSGKLEPIATSSP